ncbi:RING finger protein 227 [Eucyclogobius newberryi]|uniref:RING finger protein 227 n=1 Tax=Eucyclogobius newberryi TaxID=166745 RepID=UPI003B5B513A
MYTELECAICYLPFNTGRRCPLELRCKHTFCESCLLALSRALEAHRGAHREEAHREAHREAAHRGQDRAIVCPLCRHTTSISGEEQIRLELRVDECAMEQLLVTGLYLETEEEEEPEEAGQAPEEEGAPAESASEDSDLSGGFSRGRLRRTLRKVWTKISGKNTRDTGNDSTDMSSDDMRNLALIACYMF